MRTFQLEVLATLLVATSLFAQQPNNLCGPDCDPGAGLHCSDYNHDFDTSSPPTRHDNKYHITLQHEAHWNSDYYSPIVIDLENKNFDDAFTSVEDGITWDFIGKGSLLHMAWTNPNRKIGFLVLDRNHNGRIDSAREMFGNLTHQPLNQQEAELGMRQAAVGQAWQPNGFLALEFFDRKENGGNANGKIDAGDSIFSELRVWVDTAHDANSRDGKMYTLTELGIKSISLAYTELPRKDKYGNKLRFQGTMEMEQVGARVPQIYDVFFRGKE